VKWRSYVKSKVGEKVGKDPCHLCVREGSKYTSQKTETKLFFFSLLVEGKD
jgi:hypothetical protein